MMIFVLFASFLSSSVLASVLARRNIETILPISYFSIIILMYIGGVFGLLKPAFYAVLIISVLSYAVALIIGLRTGIASFFKRILTPGMAIYTFLFVLVWMMNRGALMSATDEFTCWGDVVKGMCYSHALSFDPKTEALFAAYPPALSILLYFTQQVNGLFAGSFDESLLYMTYQWALLAMYMPFFRGLSFRKPLSMALWCAASFFMPIMILRYSAYAIIYVDSMLAAVGGFVCVYPFLNRKNTRFDHIYFCSALFVLVLLKDVGMLFAAGGVISYALQNYCQKQGRLDKLKARKYAIYNAALAGIVVVAARISWSACLKIWNASNVQKSFSAPITLAEIGRLLNGTSQNMWRRSIASQFYHQMFNPTFRFFATDAYVSYAALMIVGALALYLISSVFGKLDDRYSKRAKAFVSTGLCVSIIYTLGLCVAYMFKYSRFEAEILSAMNRYMDTIITYLFYLFAACFTYAAGKKMIANRALAIAVAGLMLFAPFGLAMDYVSGSSCSQRAQSQQRIVKLAEKIETELIGAGVSNDERIYVFCQSNPGEFLALRTRLRPRSVSKDTWVRLAAPLNEQEVFPISADELKVLMHQHEYIVLGHYDESFFQEFSECFERPDEIELGFVYQLNIETNKLRRIGS